MNKNTTCDKSLPSSHFLRKLILENINLTFQSDDPFFEDLLARGQRRLHLLQRLLLPLVLLVPLATTFLEKFLKTKICSYFERIFTRMSNDSFNTVQIVRYTKRRDAKGIDCDMVNEKLPKVLLHY